LASESEKLSAFVFTLAIVAFGCWQEKHHPHRQMLPRNESWTERQKNLSETSAPRALGFGGINMPSSKMKRLIEKRDAVNARIKQEENKLRNNERKSDTRRKILAGAAVLQWAIRDNEFSTRLMTELKAFLARDVDRALFGLPAKQGVQGDQPKRP
jgi:hypothetical protein